MTETAATPPVAHLINRVLLRGPELETIHSHIAASGRLTRVQLRERFVPRHEQGKDRSSNLDEVLDVLWQLGLIEQDGSGENAALRARHAARGRAFKTTMLRAIREMPAGQGHLLALYARCIREGTASVTTRELLVLGRSEFPQQGQVPGRPAPLAWNNEKVGVFVNLASYLGLVTPIHGGVLIVPEPRQLVGWLIACESLTTGWAEDTFIELDREIAPCLIRGELHAGWAAAAREAARKGWLNISEGGADGPQLSAQGEKGRRPWSRIVVTETGRRA